MGGKRKEDVPRQATAWVRPIPQPPRLLHPAGIAVPVRPGRGASGGWQPPPTTRRSLSVLHNTNVTQKTFFVGGAHAVNNCLLVIHI